jgi:murein DD-endopeptidase MepM/ murein hydrolase activator NlpD
MNRKVAMYLIKVPVRIFALLAVVLALFPASVQASAVATAPPTDMFQLPWEQGLSWVAFDGFDNGFKRSLSSPHNHRMGGAVDFAPSRNMWIGMDTSNFWVTAAAAGTVMERSNCHIKIDHSNGWTSEYWHLDNLQVELGESVYRNQRLAVIHNSKFKRVCTGNEYPGPHLHFLVRPKMQDVVFAGWAINFNIFTNITTFKRDGVSLSGPFKPILNAPGLQVALRGILDWGVLHTGSLDAYRYEKWEIQLPEPSEFTLTATGTTEGLIPLIVLLDSDGNEITRASETLTSIQPAGSYFAQIQPEAGQGFYSLIGYKETIIGSTDPFTSIVINPSPIDVGQSAVASVSLNNVPAEGLTSAEFACTYDPVVVAVGNIADAGLFGDDAVIAINGPQDGGFIVAIAGSNGQKAVSDGVAFTFSLTGLQEGQTSVECAARISKGDGALVDILSVPANLTVNGTGVTPTPVITPFPTATPEPPSSPTVMGQVFASKLVSVSLYSLDSSLVDSTEVDQDGIFTMTAPAGSYVIVASADGFLDAQGTIELTDGNIITMSVISLPAGDIDGNGVIDQFDALTIGMNYNASTPAVADLNDDGIINVLDLELLAANYRQSGALAWQ